MVVTTVNFRGSANPIEFSLNGFTAAYTGPGMEEKDFQQEQIKAATSYSIKSKKKLKSVCGLSKRKQSKNNTHTP